MIALDLDRLFQGRRIPAWLREFEARPDDALQDLLLGRAPLGHLNADEPSEVLLDWLEILGPPSGFPELVDAALTRWIARSWGRPTLPIPGASAAVVARAWIRAADLIAFEPRLEKAARQLRSFFPEGRSFLSALAEGRARDPEGRVWLALARHQSNRSLLDDWWLLCDLPPDVPWYHGAYGIQGLRGLPAVTPERDGLFPREVPEGLARLADALAERVTDGWLTPATARGEFSRVAELTMAVYGSPERWLSFWRHVLTAGRLKRPEARTWVQDLFPRDLKRDVVSPTKGRKRWAEPDPDWSRRARQIAQALERRDWSVLDPARQLLSEEAAFAETTGDSYNVVRSACYFASRVRKSRPSLALEWSDLARRFEPWNAFAWTTRAASLLELGRLQEARETALKAVQRFPYDVVARTGLAEVLKARGELVEADSVYRETVERFPENVVARSGLAEVLKARGELAEAESVYRRTAERFPESVVVRTGLAEVLKARGELAESESVYRETVERFPENVVARTGLAEVLKARGELAEAESAYRETVERFPENVVAQTGLAEVLKARGDMAEAESMYRETVKRFPENVVARTGLEGVLRARAGQPEVVPLDQEPASVTPGPPPVDSSAQEPWKREIPAREAPVSAKPEEPPGQRSEKIRTWEVAERPDEPDASGASRLRRSDVEILLQDIYLLRRWGGRTRDTGALRERARRLLSTLTREDEGDPELTGALGLLEIEDGDLEQALALLREAAKRFPGSARARYALARAEREAATRRGRLDPANPQAPVLPWRYLARLDERFRPLQLLGEARTWLAQTDGSVVLENTRNCLGSLGYWTSGLKPVSEGSFEAGSHESSLFVSWWRGEVRSLVFGSALVTGYDEVGDLVPIRDRIERYATPLNRLEEDWLGHFARA